MENILIVNGSPRGDRSHSRKLLRQFEQKLIAEFPDAKINHREVGKAQIPHIDEGWIAGAFTQPDERTIEMKSALKFSDELVDIVTSQTNLYANQHKGLNPPVTNEEMKVVLSI